MNDTTAAHPSPFKFLDSYGPDDRDMFFGREAEVEELYERVFETNLILLYGASGTGKTSLINCGLANRFESTDWLPIMIRRDQNMVDSIHQAIAGHARKKTDEALPIHKKLRSLYLDYFKPVYLIFDQFEELFILDAEHEQLQLFETIKEILLTDLQVKVLISMREEYIAHLSDFEQVIPNLFDNRMRIEKMTRSNLQEVITRTAGHFNIQIEDPEAIGKLIIDSIMDPREGVELANLQIYLDKLYRNDLKRRGQQDRPLRFDADLVNTTRQLEDVLSDFLEEQLALLERELKVEGVSEKGIPMDVLFTLVTEDGTKRNMADLAVKEQLLRRKNIKPEVVNYCIKRFNELRIIRILGEG